MRDKAIDPVCGCKVDRGSTRKEWFNNTEYFFCSDACRRKFETNPHDFLTSQT